MKIEIKVPSVGESINSADIESWEKQSGDLVKKGDILVILETDKASMEIPAEQEGVLQIVKDKGVVSVGDVIGFLETDSSLSKASSSDKSSSRENNSSFSSSKAGVPLLDEVSSPPPVSSFQNTRENLSPAVRRLVESHGLDPTTLKGTGKAGRLIKEDILKALESPSSPPLSSPSTGNEISVSTSQKRTPSLRKGQKREKMTGLRRKTAEKLVYSQHSTATLSTFNEVDLSRIIEIRKKYQEEFLKKHGCKLGFMSFFVQAVVSALKTYPRINAFIEGEDIIYNDHQHIGIAVSTEKGLVVPVLFHAENLSLAEIEKKILEYKDKALSRKLSPDDLIGGTFTISNGGVFGSLLSTPILNPPQSGILGMHKIEQRPVVREGRVEIRPMMYLTLSYDHRIVDGRESVGFLVKVKEILEEPARLLIHF